MSATLNIVPRGDTIPHVDHAGCPCGPEVLLDKGRTHPHKAIVHNAWDRREEHENDVLTMRIVPYGESVN